jgi:arylsulfatase A-like enzyme
VDLDRNVASKDLELCRSLGELSGRLQQRGGDARPVFAYTQPQNIHVAAITREGASVPSGESYPGFYAPYASRIRRMDTCFGEFVSSLQQQGLYQNSVVILTSDHGDSLGEDGRWGHAYTLFPEILRIPLIVHLPDGLRRTASDSGPAFLTDITPTLYDLLGRRPTMNHELFGRSLLNDLSTGRPPQPRDRYLVASSYGPTYGVLGGDGRSLYLVDATNYRDYYFDLGTDPAGRENLISPDVRREYEPIVRKGVDAIGRFYRIPGD